MRRSCILMVAVLSMFLMNESAFSQLPTNTSGPLGQNWPSNPPVGIGTVGDGFPQNALQIHHDPSNLFTWPAMIRLSDGASDSINDFGMLGLMPDVSGIDTPFSSLSRGYDLILHEHLEGDIIITNFSRRTPTHLLGGAIRFATSSDTNDLPIPPPGHHDLERLTINQNGNVGIGLPPVTTGTGTGLDSALDQLQLGGSFLLPGLTLYGGNRFEGLNRVVGGISPVDWRYIGYNFGINHSDSSSGRFFRMAHTGASNIEFSDIAGGLVELNGFPYDSSRGMHDFTHGVTFEISGQQGLQLWSYNGSTDPYHHLVDVWKSGYVDTGIGITRNTNGLFYHHTPVYIGSDSGWAYVDLQNLPVHPRLGDGLTWMLAVNGPALFKEVYVSTDWADFVFKEGYPLPSLDEVENYTKANHHLPDVPSADEMAKTGVPLGATEAKMMQKIEELTRYVIELNHKIEALEAESKNEKEK
jgi:hypothetical protein